METSADEYTVFRERVRRTVYVGNLSPHTTDAILKAAFEQFCEVVNIQFIPNYINPQTLPCVALVEMKTEKEAQSIIAGVSLSPFMISGMPRPVTARAAEEEMFEDRPRKRVRNITLQWLAPADPNYDTAMKMKDLARKHAKEAKRLLNDQLEKEENLAKRQEDTLRASHRKYELIDHVIPETDVLAGEYHMRLADH